MGNVAKDFLLISDLIRIVEREGERPVVQGMLIGSVVAVMSALMLLLNGLDKPFHDGVGGLEPVAMERSLRTIDEVLSALGAEVRLPCDASGKPVPS